MKILRIENDKENKFLHKETKRVDLSGYSKAQLRKIVADMRKAMLEANGVGLAANQVGLDMQLFVARNEGKFYALFNPKIVEKKGEKIEMEEGCLSVPGKQGLMERYEEVILEGENIEGKKIKIKAWGVLAHIFQHEMDHLAGVVYTDHAKNVYELKDE